MYTWHDVLEKYSGFTNHEFLQSLRDRDFFVAERAVSNYSSTQLTISTTVAMDYIFEKGQVERALWTKPLHGFNPTVDRFLALGCSPSALMGNSLRCLGRRIKKDDVPEGTWLDVPLDAAAKAASPCFELYRRAHVLADGNVGACVCVDLESEIKIGNVVEQSLDEIWRGDKLRRYRRDWTRGQLPKVCESCTRYQGVDTFIAENRKRVAIDYARRRFPWLLGP